MPAEVTASLRAQGLWPDDLFIGNPRGPETRRAASDGSYRQAADGWIVGTGGLIRFDAVQDMTRVPGGTPAHPTLKAASGWRVTGTRTPFREPAWKASKTVPFAAPPAAATSTARKGRWVGPDELRYVETLPATARTKLLSVVSPTLVDSHITRLTSIPGVYGFVVIAVAASTTEAVAVEGRKYINAKAGESEATADARLSTAPWELTILRGIFREQVEAR
jgi:hypothetical protein